MMWRKIWNCVHPSIAAASSISIGIESKNPFSIQTHSGSAVTEYAMIRPMLVFSSPRDFMIMKYGSRMMMPGNICTSTNRNIAARLPLNR